MLKGWRCEYDGGCQILASNIDNDITKLKINT